MLGRMKAKSSAKNGLGAINSRVCTSFVEGSCSCCGSSIPNPAIFGNAWVISDSSVELLCIKCRGIDGVRRVDSKHYDRAMIFNLAKKIEAKHSNAWLRLIYACRTGGALLNRHSVLQKQAFEVNLESDVMDSLMHDDIVYQLERTRPMSEYYGSVTWLNYCGECQAPAQDNLGHSEDGTKCKNCGMPDLEQWNVRTTFEEEIKRAKALRL